MLVGNRRQVVREIAETLKPELSMKKKEKGRVKGQGKYAVLLRERGSFGSLVF